MSEPGTHPGQPTGPLKHTPLHDWHEKAGARLVDFGGWEMPLHYGSQIAEHHAVRRHAGLFDVSHMAAVDVTGPLAQSFLRHLLANDVAKLQAPGQALYSCMLNPEGGVVDDLIVYGLDADSRQVRYRLVVNAACAPGDIQWMTRIAATWRSANGAQAEDGEALAITPRPELAMIALQGPEAEALLTRHAAPWLPPGPLPRSFHGSEPAGTAGDWLLARTGYTGEDGFEITLPQAAALPFWQALVDGGATPCGLGARDTLRLEAGMALYGQDMDAHTDPREAGLGWTLATQDGARHFIGRAALDNRSPAAKTLGLVLQSPGVMRSGQSIATEHGPGLVKSGGFSPTLQKSIALARMPLAVNVGDTVQVTLRNATRPSPATVVTPPFARHGKILIPPGLTAPIRA